ncbi:MAG: glycosyltransferase family 4 protein [bacterium]
MARLMEMVHPDEAWCHVIFLGARNTAFCQLLGSLGVGYTTIPCCHWLELARTLRQRRINVAYLFGNLRIIPWAWAAHLSRVPVVVAGERNVPTGHLKRLGRRLDRHFVNGYICNSERARLVLHNSCNIPSWKLHVIYNGLREDAYSPHLCGVTSEPVLICVANIQPRKGHLVLLKGVARLRVNYPDLRVLLVGTDNTDGAFFEEADGLGLQNAYTWTGYVPDVSTYLHMADVFVLPSVEREGMPTSVLEAMSAGLPVVATRVGGVSELVQDGVTGFLVPPGDVSALVASVGRLLASPKKRREMGLAGRAYVLKHHTMDKMVCSHLSLFRELLALRVT